MRQIEKRESTAVFTPNRLEALTDGVFAIVMTLLVLDISIPVIEESVLQSELPHRLLELLPKLYSYALSFIALGLIWIGHRFAFHFIKRCDIRLIWFNIIFLMFVALIPFSTSLMADYLMEQLPLVIILINLMLVLIMRFIIWTYATMNYRLVDRDIDPQFVKMEKLTTIVFASVALIGICVTFVSTAAVWYAMWVLLAFAFITGGGQPKPDKSGQ